MNAKLKAMLIADHGLKADATDAEASQFIADNNIKVLDISEPRQAQIDYDGKLSAMETKINAKLDNVEQSVATMNVQLKDSVEDDPTLGYDSPASFFMDVIEAGRTGKPSEKLNRAHEIRIKNTVGSDEAKTTVNPDGGFLIPPAYFPELMQTNGQAIQTDTGMMTRNIPMGTDVVHINARVDKNHSASVSGGFRVYRRKEAETVTASKAQFEQIKLEANSLMGLAYATDEILTRSPQSFAALIQSGFEDERISKLNNERLRGTGAGEYLGILNSSALVTIAKEAAQSADTILGANIIKMRARAYGYANMVWMVNQDCYQQLTAAHISGTNTDNYLFTPGNGVDVPDTLLGRPVVFDENMSTLGDLGDIALVNWSEYLEGQLGGSSFSESVHVRFVYNETAFKFNTYNAGAPWWRTALTPKKSSATLSPFITLAARA